MRSFDLDTSPSSHLGADLLELGPFTTYFAPTGMVCSPDHLASSSGAAILRAGGSAADAAVAASAVLAVVAPHMCGMGGDLLALVHTTAGPPDTLLSSGRSGSGADPEPLRASGLTRPAFRGDIRSVPVPGCVDGWVSLHERFGRLPMTEVLADATRLADRGFPVSALLAAALPLVEHVEGADLPARGRSSFRPGVPWVRRGVANALRAIAERGRAGFYEGTFGEGLMTLGAGEYTDDDLRRSCAEWVEPLGLAVFGHHAWTIPPPSQGYLSLAAAWIAEGLDLPDDPDDGRWAHLLVEAARQAGHDRPEILHEQADGRVLLDGGRLAARRAAIADDAASRLPHPHAEGGTIYLCAADADGMGVSLMQSNASDFGAHLAEPGTGIFLHNRGIGFNLEPGHPAEYGPARRPPTTLSPALVTKPDGTLHTLLGSMGGDSQPQIVLQLLARLLRHRQRPGTAISAARFVLANHGGGEGFDTWMDADLLGVDLEQDVPTGWQPALVARGHRVRMRPPWLGFGHAHAITGVDGGWAGMADPRAGSGGAVGW
jgi:gamma-glutamyltranspeptidase / glutathione hydrolase